MYLLDGEENCLQTLCVCQSVPVFGEVRTVVSSLETCILKDNEVERNCCWDESEHTMLKCCSLYNY